MAETKTNNDDIEKVQKQLETANYHNKMLHKTVANLEDKIKKLTKENKNFFAEINAIKLALSENKIEIKFSGDEYLLKAQLIFKLN